MNISHNQAYPIQNGIHKTSIKPKSISTLKRLIQKSQIHSVIMPQIRITKTQRRQRLPLLFQLLLLFYAPAPQEATAPSSNASTAITRIASASSSFVPHRFTSNNNITILHEVHEITADDDRPIELNTHEVLPVKPLKKKPYTLLDKTIFSDYEKPRPLKDYELHPVTFDFNLGDLEDLEHETIKKGDLSAEVKHLLRNDNDEGLTYTERKPLLDSADADSVVGVGAEPDDDVSIVTTSSTASVTSPTATTFPTPSSANTATNPTTTSTVSPHILKVLKNKTIKKGRELLKQDEMQKISGNNFNSISHYFDSEPTADANATAASLQDLFQIITNLYDHFYWQASDIRTKVTTACGLEMQAYLTALHGSYEWAQKAYDASGRYRGQLFFGNDKWLGQKTFCYELNRQLIPEERKHFEFGFYAAVVSLHLRMPQKLDVNLQVGECLPKSCTSQDVHAILSLDPHALTLTTLSNANNVSATSNGNNTYVRVQRVRTVPGIFSYWLELKFQIFASFLLTLVLLVSAATWYQAKLNRRQLTSPHIPAISAKIDAAMGAHGIALGAVDVPYSNNGKAVFELYQMSTLNDNNNVVDIEADVNGNKAGADNAAARQSRNEVAEQVNRNGNANGNGSGNGGVEVPAAATTTKQMLGELSVTDVEKSQMADYKLDTGSSAGAAGTYEAKKHLAMHEKFLLCFAFQTNAGTIFDISDNKENQTSCVHGLRVFSVLWTIMVHTYLQMFTIGENRFQRVIVERSVWYQFVGNATFSVDTFFFISGFLVTLLFLKQEKKYPDDTRRFVRRSLVDTGYLLIYRYLRLTPAYLFVIFFNDFTLRQTFDNSVFQPNVAAGTCSQYWWRNILYINNFYPLSEICMIWSWYMANDMQFFIMGSLLLALSVRYFKTAVLIICSFLLSSWSLSGIISLHHHYTHKVANPFESFDFLYDKPWQRVGTYIMGMVAGYVMYKVKKPPQISQRINLLLWFGSLTLLGLIIFGVWGGELNKLATAFYVSMGHTAFGLGLVWIVLSCSWGISPTVNRILSYRCLWPLSRLTYCTYLVHPVIMLITSFRMSGAVHLNNLFVVTIFLGNAVVSFSVAFFISVLFEAPIIRILKICFRK